ncbi:MAG TPA: S8 family serine peptidase [Steroidobacteraceae bacterium]|nr:S8 family serine peptidase [Steroidobacteraceae bacterium]
MRRFLLLALALAAASAARAQIRLPSLPRLPLPAVTQALNQGEPTVLDSASDLRHERIKRLIRDNRKLIEADPNGEPIVRGEILASGVSDEALARLRASGFAVDRERTIAGADFRLLVLKTAPGTATQKVLRELRSADPNGLYDYNHIYLTSGLATFAQIQGAPASATGRSEPAPAPRIRVGLIDTGIDTTHPAFGESLVHGWGCGGTQHPDAHGTAVASLLAAHAAAEIYAADVFCGLPTGGSVDDLIAALGWLVDERVAVINVSLVGPRNALLERAVHSLIERGYLLVAAVGNDGPAAPPLYPAAYPDVVGVTGVDAHRRVLLEAERGPQVMFAAPGADLEAADLKHRYAAVRGTSYAAPTVAALLAGPLSSPDREAALAAIDRLAQSAIHLGAPGRDLTYGFGLVGSADR